MFQMRQFWWFLNTVIMDSFEECWKVVLSFYGELRNGEKQKEELLRILTIPKSPNLPLASMTATQCIYGQKVGIPISLECCCRFEMGITSWCKNSKPLITVNCAGWTSLLMWTCNIKFENSPIMSHYLEYYEKIAKFYLHSSLLPSIWRKIMIFKTIWWHWNFR